MNTKTSFNGILPRTFSFVLELSKLVEPFLIQRLRKVKNSFTYALAKFFQFRSQTIHNDLKCGKNILLYLIFWRKHKLLLHKTIITFSLIRFQIYWNYSITDEI